MNNEVYITGTGIVSALGSGTQAHLDALTDGRTGLRLHEFFNGTLPDPCMCGKVPDNVLSADIDATAGSRATDLAEIALSQAIISAAVKNMDKADLVCGTTLGNMHGGTLYFNELKKGFEPSTDLVKNVMPDSIASSLAVKHSIKGKHLTVSSACASGTTAIGTAFRRIVRGQCSCAAAGGVDALSPFVIAGFNSLRLLSKKQCRPFCATRDGLNPGEGAAFVTLENESSVQARGVMPLARLRGYGTALEAYHYTRSHPDGTGLSSAIRKALDSAGLCAQDIDHIHAHGTATVPNDLSEYNGYNAVFGERLKNIPVSSTKSMTGHTYGAAGAISAVLSILTIKNGVIPPTLFCTQPDPLFSNLSVSEKPRVSPVKRVLSVAVGFGGEVAAIILEAL